MKKLFFIFFNIFLISSLSTIYAWDDCPYGKTDSSCTFPGECGKYIDTNNNGICDHSEPAPTMSGAPSNIPPTSEGTMSEELIDKYVPTPSSELKNYTIKQVCEEYNISQDCLINALKSKINEINEMSKSSPSDEIQLTEEIVDEYIDISGSELKSYTIKQICEMYGINPEDLKRNLGISDSVSDDTTFYTIKKTYGISPSKSNEAILKCLIDDGKVVLDTKTVQDSIDKSNQLKETLINELNENTTLNEIKEVYGLSPTDLKEAILNCMIDEGIVSIDSTNVSTNGDNLNTSESIIDKIIKFLFTELDLRNLFKIN